MKKFDQFIFESYQFDKDNLTIDLNYSFDGQLNFTETISWNDMNIDENYSEAALDAAMSMLHVTLGVSYYKAYMPAHMAVKSTNLTSDQSVFFNDLYSNGLGEFIYRNGLKFSDIASFQQANPVPHLISDSDPAGTKALVPMSGGKDSILTAEILKSAKIDFRPLYMTTDGNYPGIIDQFEKPILVKRQISKELIAENKLRALNGHVPFSAILDSILAVTAVLYGFADVVLSHESSADEATVEYDGRSVNHQYSKSSIFEKLISNFVKTNISAGISFFSLLRNFSELEIHKLFVRKGLFDKYNGEWSSCNQANYKQGQDTTNLRWCGKCSKCANAFILFAPFADKDKLIEMFSGNNLATNSELENDFKSLLGMNESKPFECVGEINELRHAITMAFESGDWPEFERYVLQLKKQPEQKSARLKIDDKYQIATEDYIA